MRSARFALFSDMRQCIETRVIDIRKILDMDVHFAVVRKRIEDAGQSWVIEERGGSLEVDVHSRIAPDNPSVQVSDLIDQFGDRKTNPYRYAS